jgi:hypothetical protein
VLVSRCAWHPRNYGHGKLFGVTSWRGLRIHFTDGICRKCAARVQLPRRRPVAAGSPVARGGNRASKIIVVALAILTGLVLIARPANEGSTPVDVVHLLPRALTVVQAGPTEPPGAPVRARRPGGARATTTAAARLPVLERVQSP